MSEISDEELLHFLREAPFHAHLRDEDLSDLRKILEIRDVAAGTEVVKQGEPGDGWFLIREGELSASREVEGGGTRVLGVMKPPQCFGEIAIVEERPRSASVQASTDCVLLHFPLEGFRELADAGRPVAFRLVLGIARSLSERTRKLTEALDGAMTELRDEVYTKRIRL